MDPVTGVVTGIAGGTATITVSRPNRSSGTITGGMSGGLMAPAPQRTVKVGSTQAPGATVAPQPTRKADATSTGGGILNDFGTVTVSNSTIVYNHASGSGGGIANNDITRVTVKNSTIANNSALTGGGIDNAGTMTITNSTIANNSASLVGHGGIDNTGTLNASNNLIVNNTDVDLGTYGINGTDTNNLTGTFTFANGETTPQDHGGPTRTLAIPTPAMPTSTDAYQGGNLAACQAISPAYDQRGAARVVAGKCSIGAFEPGLVNTATVLTADHSGTIPYGTSVTFTATVSGVLRWHPARQFR